MRNKISNLFQLIVSGEIGKDRYGFLGKVIPKNLLEDDQKKWLSLTGVELDLHNEIYNDLRTDTRSEHLKDRDIADTVWWYICDAFLNPDNYSTNQQRKQIGQQLIDDILSPLHEYEILFHIQNAKSVQGVIDLQDTQILQIDESWLKQWIGRRRAEQAFSDELNEFFGKAGILIHEKGGAPGPVVSRARKKGTKSLDAVRSFLSSGRKWHDDQLLFHVSEFCLCKQCESRAVSHLWSRPWNPMPAIISSEDKDLEMLKSYRSVVEDPDIKKKVKEAFQRAISWIGDAVMSEDLNHKIIFLCTALESILCTKDDGMKGESIAYRMILLATETQKGFISPMKILWLYNERSSLIHGSRVDIANKPDYLTLRRAVHDVLEQSLLLVKKHRISSVANLIRYLESSESIGQAVEWLEKQSEHFEEAKPILKAIRDKGLQGNKPLCSCEIIGTKRV